MASNIENIEGIIKEEVIYADVADVPGLYHVVQSGECFVHEDGTVVNGADVQCQEIVIDAEDNNVFPKYEVVETDGTFANVYEFDPNCTVSSSAPYFAFNSGSESSPMKRDVSQTSSNNSFDNNNYIVPHHSRDRSQRGQSLREKQLELNNIKQFGTRNRATRQDQDEWYPNNDREVYRDDNQMGDDDYEGEYSSRRRTFGRIGSRTSKPKKRIFAYRLQWKDEDMKQAMKKVSDHSMTIRGAAKHYNVPYSTLKDRVRGRVTHGTKPGVKTALSPADERELVRIVNHMVACGFNIQCLDIREKAHEILKRNPRHYSAQMPNMPGHNWLSGFLKRHPEAKVNRPSGRIASPSTSKLTTLIKRFFEVSSRVYRTIDGEDKSSRIYCMTSIQLQSLPKTSIILTASADGTLFPPYVIGNFDSSAVPLMHQAFPEATFVTSSDMSRERLLLFWFRDFFLPKVNLQRSHNVQKPHVLFLNQSNRNVSVRMVELSMENNVNLVCMPINLTQALQPLNSLSTSLEQCYQKCLKWVIINGMNMEHSDMNGETGPELSDIQIAQTLKKLFDKRESFREEIQKNFSDAGVFPLNSRAISVEKITSSTNDDEYLGNFTESYEDNQDGDYARDGIQDEGGLHLLSELSTAVRTPPDSSTYEERYSNQISRHPSTYKYKNSFGYSQVLSERRAPRMKRSAAGESEKFMKRILCEGGDNDYGDDVEKHSKRPRVDESDECSLSSLDSEIGGCARTRPIRSNHSSTQHDSMFNETASEFDGKDLYRLSVDDRKSSNRYSIREAQHLHSTSYNINDADIISQAVASILPKEELFYQDNPNIKLPAQFMKTPKLRYVLKRPNHRLVPNFANQSTSAQSRHRAGFPGLTLTEKVVPPVPIKMEEIVGMPIQEEVVTGDIDQYFVQDPQLASEEVTVEEIVMDDIVTAIYDEVPASETTVESLIFEEQPSSCLEDAAILNINQQEAEELSNSAADAQSLNFEQPTPASDSFIINYAVTPVQVEEQAISNEDIVLGDGVYKASQMVKMTTHLKLNNHPVQIIRSVTLKEAMETFQRNDPKVIKCNLEFIKS